jgi:hypothetical protein
MKTPIEIYERQGREPLRLNDTPKDQAIRSMEEYASQQVAAERERIKKELLDIINLYNDNEMFGFSVAKNAIENL